MSSKSKVEPYGILPWNVLQLAEHLRQERLFVSAEQQNLQNLNEKVLYVLSDLAQLTWVTDQQRVNLNKLIVSRPDCTPALCCQRANALENSQFLGAYKCIRYQSCLVYGEFLGALRKSPDILAACLVEGEKFLPDMVQNIIQSLSAGLYGSCLLPEDKIFVLKLLKQLMLLQIVPSDNPRRLLRHGTCAFSRFYSVFHESLFSAKLFLTAALHGPITQLLMEDEMFLDIDPDKVPIRFPPSERLKKFGVEGSSEYQSKLLRYRLWTINSLVRITQRFITSIRENMYCFPTSILWLVKQLAGFLNKSGNIESKEVHAMCTDLVFTYFICPAIVNPEPYGITDAPINYVARFNLMQVGQILQMLSLMKYQTIDNKVMDLYRRFEKDSVSIIIDLMLEGIIEELDDEPKILDHNKLQGLNRSAALFTENELNSLIIFLQTVCHNETEVISPDNSTLDRKKLSQMLALLPSGSVMSNKIVNITPLDSVKRSSGLLGKVGINRGLRPSTFSNPCISNDGVEEINNIFSFEEECINKVSQEVLVIPFGSTLPESVGFLSEHKILCMENQNNMNPGSVTLNLSTDSSNNNRRNSTGPERIEIHEKRTRFSLSHDEVLFEGSIGNTSDNLEVVSEAASNHSVASSLELETEDQNDNLSDMVSANVSGRGSPNISGRDTPSSQITEGEDVRASGEVRPLDLPAPTISTKQSRSEIDDKFCKFEIKKLIEGDETISLVSDTWSTDVLASDSEIVEHQDRFLFPPLAEQTSGLSVEPLQGVADVSETASEAWSMDVLASDSERLTEVDTDDTSSVARSDDTGRSEIESRGEPEVSEESSDVVHISTGPLLDSINTLLKPNSTEINQEEALISLSPTSSSAGRSTSFRSSKPDNFRSIIDYVDNNANNVNRVEYLKSIKNGKLINMMDKLNIDGEKDTSVNLNSNNHIGVVAVAPELLLASHISSPHLSNEKSLNGDTKSAESEDFRTSVNDVIVRLSTTSLTSSSSSGSESKVKTLNHNSESIPLSSTNNSNDNNENSNNSIGKSNFSTGAIPKSISFDITAVRGDREYLDDQKHKRGFFSKFKMSLKNRRGKSLRETDELGRCYDRDIGADGIDVGRYKLRKRMSEDITTNANNNVDSTDDILAKYRRKPNVVYDTVSADNSQIRPKETEDERLSIDSNNVESSFAFSDAKRKLRMVLSTADLQHIPWNISSEKNACVQKENELIAFLQLQLAEAINLQDRSLIAHLHETLRCVRLFNDDGCRKLFQSLKDDYEKRSPYVAYLIRCRQGLLSTLAHLERRTSKMRSRCCK
ncbi:GTPase-activating protein and VPS9 domain-containing protein 1 isoform X2 [Cotesia glomerata]|uniref:GTPase-activating protein and VPS9 domain-containing protein 1 isoform X2 n=1 Tax=Cotesia glomerata TaxID=32391 RepID=UPI001D02C7EB|nr:GTPase-activating protein and VPS9 domain-containing protein 1 isoform X2 [Cotesia glomerata]